MMYSWIAIFSLCVCFSQPFNLNYPNGATTQVTCDKSETQSYLRIGEKYYFLGKNKVNWFDSAHLCRQFGGDLALIESAEEMEAISTALKNGHTEHDWFWISGNDLVETHKFASITNGLPLAFTSWSAGQPDYPGKEQCMHLWLRDGAFRMNNWVCTEKAYYLCQRQNYTRCWDGC
ncbi:C-type lectin 37Db-like [Drosophila innubila]|uniref:C-type lectin 37Db-like n=1 Tax=Drosophila innubila TaxID=198719 RepID=UPI00148C7C40|nr:C-type lectin 37Db-like [Drosophila innubila]